MPKKYNIKQCYVSRNFLLMLNVNNIVAVRALRSTKFLNIIIIKIIISFLFSS